MRAKVISYGLLCLLCVPFVFPTWWMVTSSLKPNADIFAFQLWPERPSFQAWRDVFTLQPFAQQYLNSAYIALVVTLGTLVVSSMAGYAFARMSFRFKGLMLALILSILMVPSQVYLIPQYQIIQSLGWLDSIQGIIAPGIFSAFGTFLMMQFFRTIPAELEEAARLDGCNPWQTFWKVVLPVARPGLISLAIITVLASWADLLWPLVIATSPEKMPLSVGLATLAGYQGTISPGVLMAAALMAMAPVLILFVVLQRRVVEGIAFSGLK